MLSRPDAATDENGRKVYEESKKSLVDNLLPSNPTADGLCKDDISHHRSTEEDIFQDYNTTRLKSSRTRVRPRLKSEFRLKTLVNNCELEQIIPGAHSAG